SDLVGGQARLRHRRLCHRAARLRAALSGDRDRHQARQPGAGLLRPGAQRPQRPALHHVEIPLDGGGRRKEAGGVARPQRDERARLQDARRSARHEGGALPPPDLARRASAVLERPGRSDEHRRAATTASLRRRSLRALAPAPTLGQAGPDLHLAGERPQRDRLRGLDEARPGLHRPVVAVARLQDLLADDPRGPFRPRGPLARLSWFEFSAPARTDAAARQSECFTRGSISAYHFPTVTAWWARPPLRTPASWARSRRMAASVLPRHDRNAAVVPPLSGVGAVLFSDGEP